jgi:hypothetical protein
MLSEAAPERKAILGGVTVVNVATWPREGGAVCR